MNYSAMVLLRKGLVSWYGAGVISEQLSVTSYQSSVISHQSSICTNH